MLLYVQTWLPLLMVTLTTPSPRTGCRSRRAWNKMRLHSLSRR